MLILIHLNLYLIYEYNKIYLKYSNKIHYYKTFFKIDFNIDIH